MMALGRSAGKVGFIGVGNMGGAMVRALVAQRVLDGESIMAVNKDNRLRMEALRAQCGIVPARSLAVLTRACKTILIAVKPHQVVEATAGARGLLTQEHLVISVVAGVTLARLRDLLGDGVSIVRAMPNTPVQVSEGAVALSGSEGLGQEYREEAERLFGAVGKVFWVDESLMDAVTALSGSGPAYFYRLAVDLAKAAELLGLERSLAVELARQTLVGAGALLKGGARTAEDLLRQVVSPNGTTEAALREMDARDFSSSIRSAVARAWERSKELARDT